MSKQTELDFDEVHEIEEPKRLRLSLHMMVKRHLPQEAIKWSQDDILTALDRITHLRLDRENIGHIDNLELLGNSITNVYLQHNCIAKIEGLETLQKLHFLTLSCNQIQRIEGLGHLKSLSFLDLSQNLIQGFDIDELPQSLVILNLKDNGCTTLPDYRGRIIQDLPNLRQLDLQQVSRVERQEAGYVVSSESDEGEEEEEEEGEGEAGPSYTMAADGDLFKHATSDILLRSQVRLEDLLEEHKQKLGLLDDMREQHNIPPSARSTPCPGSQKQTVPSWSKQRNLVSPK